MDVTFSESDNSPAIYKVRFEKPSELMHVYSNVILNNARVDEVHTALCEYVCGIIEPIGWKAIWRHNNFPQLSFECDFEVEVVDVSRNSLDADVVVLRLISPEESLLTSQQFNEVKRLLKDIKVINVPLIQLYVMSENDSEELYYNTAVVIEQIRFFYRVIWRPWDENNANTSSNDELFVNTRLQPRLELYFDIKDKIIPQSTVNKINRLLEEAWNIKAKIDAINNYMAFDDNAGADDYVDEKEFMDALRLKLQLDNIERQMKLLEDRHTRIIATNVNSLICLNNNYDELDGECAKIHLVSKCFTVQNTNEALSKLMQNESEKMVLFHTTLGSAISLAKTGEKVYIMPGVYKCDALPWLENDIEVIGFGLTREDVNILSNDSVGDMFLNCNAKRLSLSNLTLTATTEMQSIIMIHTGELTIKDSILDCGKCTRNGIISLKKGKLFMKGCEIINIDSEDSIVSDGNNVVINKHMEYECDSNHSNLAAQLFA